MTDPRTPAELSLRACRVELAACERELEEEREIVRRMIDIGGEHEVREKRLRDERDAARADADRLRTVLRLASRRIPHDDRHDLRYCGLQCLAHKIDHALKGPDARD